MGHPKANSVGTRICGARLRSVVVHGNNWPRAAFKFKTYILAAKMTIYMAKWGDNLCEAAVTAPSVNKIARVSPCPIFSKTSIDL